MKLIKKSRYKQHFIDNCRLQLARSRAHIKNLSTEKMSKPDFYNDILDETIINSKRAQKNTIELPKDQYSNYQNPSESNK